MNTAMLLSNNTKVVLFNDNALEGQPIQHTKCIVVEHYEFCLSRNLNSFGEAYGEGAGSEVKVKIRIGSRDGLKVYYERMSQEEKSFFSLLFNVHYDDNDNVNDDYDGGLILEGFLVDIEEEYVHQLDNDGADECFVTLSILLSSLSCMGNSRNLTYNFG